MIYVSSALDFFHGGKDPRGRTYSQIIALQDNDLHLLNDYLPWIFPLRKGSFNQDPWSPSLSEEEVEKIRSDRRAKKLLRDGLFRLAKYYGFEKSGTPSVPSFIQAKNFKYKCKFWLKPNSEHYDKIKRILQSVHSLGEENWAWAFFRTLENCSKKYPGNISEIDIESWRDAMGLEIKFSNRRY